MQLIRLFAMRDDVTFNSEGGPFSGSGGILSNKDIASFGSRLTSQIRHKGH